MLFVPLVIYYSTQQGNVYFVDNYRIRKVTVSTGIITTIAGNGVSTFGGDGGAATSASMGPGGVAFDSSGNVYLSDCNNHRIRKITISTGIINTIAGTGATTFSGDGGAATSATVSQPKGVALDAAGNHYSPYYLFSFTNSMLNLGNVYCAVFYNQRVRKITVSTGIMSTVAGSSTSAGYSGDNGQATAAKLYQPSDVALDTAGTVDSIIHALLYLTTCLLCVT